MMQDITQIAGYPSEIQQIKAVSDILDLAMQPQPQLCFTITFQNDTFVNIYQSYTETDRSWCYQEISRLHDQVIAQLDIANQNLLDSVIKTL